MMTKEEHIEYWINSAQQDWDAVHSLINGKNYIQALFFAHLVLEKISKAIWIKYNESNIPPKIHNILKLLSQTPVNLSMEQLEYLVEVNKFQLEGRYPDYKNTIFRICTLEYTENNLNKIEEIKICLIKNLQ
jgi:HEPN domain-containing protein